MAKVLSINIAKRIHTGEWTGSEGRTGIDKEPVSGAIEFKDDSVAGDSVIDRKAHGGYDKAVYAYAIEDAKWWEGVIGRELRNGSFGENLTVQGIDLNASLIGERWSVGSVVLEVSEPRIPCRVFAGFWDRPTLIKEFTDAKRSGTYLRIIEAGRISAGDEIKVISKPDHEISVLDIFEAKAGNREKIQEIVKVTELSAKYLEWAKKVAIGS
jgi:MOSC domain-containing protein YiiM